MPGEKRNKVQRAAHREQIAELRLKGVTLVKIAEKVGISLPTVKRELRKLEAEWKAQAAANIEEVKARELQKLDLLEAEAWAEWERSKKDWVKKTVQDGKGGGKRAKVESGGQCGDPRYLQVILGIRERRAKLLGMDAPSKVAATSPDGKEERPMGFFPVPPPTTPEAWLQWVESLRQKPAQT